MQKQSISDYTAVSGFVSPCLAFDLMREGFPGEAAYFWRRHGNEVALDTFLFDVDKYYSIPNEILTGDARPVDSFPAYTIGDVQKFLPDYCLCRVNNDYEISLDKNYRVEGEMKANRLADAFALAALKCLDLKIIQPKFSNKHD